MCLVVCSRCLDLCLICSWLKSVVTTKAALKYKRKGVSKSRLRDDSLSPHVTELSSIIYIYIDNIVSLSHDASRLTTPEDL